MMLDEQAIRDGMVASHKAGKHFCSHRWAESGMVRSWCAKCSAVGQFDTEAGEYKEIDP